MQKESIKIKNYKCVKNRIKQTSALGFFECLRYVYAKQKINLTWPKAFAMQMADKAVNNCYFVFAEAAEVSAEVITMKYY